MKRELLQLAMATGAFGAFRIANRSRLAILMYHSFDLRNDFFAVPGRVLAQHLDYLTRLHTPIPLSLAAALLEAGEPLPPRAAVLTIDDGYRDVYDVAFPILRSFGVPATVFVVTDFMDGAMWLWHDQLRFLAARSPHRTAKVPIGGRHIEVDLEGPRARLLAAAALYEFFKELPQHAKPEALARAADALDVELPDEPPEEYRALTWDQAREMARHGIEIGSHTRTHASLTALAREELQAELVESRRRIQEEIEGEATLLCYPSGDYDGAVREAARSAGYRAAVTIEPGLNDRGADLLALKRLPAERRLTTIAQAASGFEEAKHFVRRAFSRRVGGVRAR